MTPTERARAVVGAVQDPEIRVLTIEELGILRDVRVEGRCLVVTITPTYVACPAMDVIRADITAAGRAAGFAEVSVRTVLSPEWTTDWLDADARAKLAAAGISPPRPARQPPDAVLGRSLLPIVRCAPRCPRCRSRDAAELARFGSTPCKALWRCIACREPFEHFKEH